MHKICANVGQSRKKKKRSSLQNCVHSDHLLTLFIDGSFLLPPLCLKGVVEGDLAAVEAYKTSGGDIARQLTSDEVRLLNRPSAFDDGFTLVHLAIRFQRQDMLAVLLTEVSADLVRFQESPTLRYQLSELCL